MLQFNLQRILFLSGLGRNSHCKRWSIFNIFFPMLIKISKDFTIANIKNRNNYGLCHGQYWSNLSFRWKKRTVTVPVHRILENGTQAFSQKCAQVSCECSSLEKIHGNCTYSWKFYGRTFLQDAYFESITVIYHFPSVTHSYYPLGTSLLIIILFIYCCAS